MENIISSIKDLTVEDIKSIQKELKKELKHRKLELEKERIKNDLLYKDYTFSDNGFDFLDNDIYREHLTYNVKLFRCCDYNDDEFVHINGDGIHSKQYDWVEIFKYDRKVTKDDNWDLEGDWEYDEDSTDEDTTYGAASMDLYFYYKLCPIPEVGRKYQSFDQMEGYGSIATYIRLEDDIYQIMKDGKMERHSSFDDSKTDLENWKTYNQYIIKFLD